MKVRRRLDDTPRKFGDKRETKLAKAGGYKRTPGSGSSSAKGDLRRGDFMVEHKATRADSYRLTDETLSKVRNDAVFAGKTPVIIVELGTGRQYAIMDLSVFESLTDDQV